MGLEICAREERRWKLSEHTKGPWLIRHDIAIYGGEDGKRQVACCNARIGAGMPTEDRANARLIAAAPEMLELLKEHLADNPASDSVYCVCDLCVRTRALLAKIEARP